MAVSRIDVMCNLAAKRSVAWRRWRLWRRTNTDSTKDQSPSGTKGSRNKLKRAFASVGRKAWLGRSPALAIDLFRVASMLTLFNTLSPVTAIDWFAAWSISNPMDCRWRSTLGVLQHRISKSARNPILIQGGVGWTMNKPVPNGPSGIWLLPQFVI